MFGPSVDCHVVLKRLPQLDDHTGCAASPAEGNEGHRHLYPLPELFMALCPKKSRWLPLAAGEAVKNVCVSSARHAEKGWEWP